MGISRGTVKKAYSQLESLNIIKIIWGSGAYIAQNDELSDKHSERAQLAALMDTMHEKGYTQQEIEAFAFLRLSMGRLKRKASIALIESCPEVMGICQKRLNDFADGLCRSFLISDVKGFTNKDNIFQDYDIILSDIEHYYTVAGLIPLNAHRITTYSLALSADTNTALSEIKTADQVGIFTQSRTFRELINNRLLDSGIRVHDRDCVYQRWVTADDFAGFISNKHTLIMPPMHVMDISCDMFAIIRAFIENGGRLINTDLVMDRNTLIYIEEKIANILYNVNGT
jgi:hypothetical protein